ncbi:MAG: UDP-3-O-[3-hydroxymyristoyl] glucosamine N-acyltransferase, partial [Microbacterium sp.]|nr:UDP-3-O-[3-hydroxymyristoyl] glucosamine N-acyltransferase [Microbacterium sp.]
VRTQVGHNARVATGSLIGDDEIINDGEAVATDQRGLRLAA